MFFAICLLGCSSNSQARRDTTVRVLTAARGAAEVAWEMVPEADRSNEHSRRCEQWESEAGEECPTLLQLIVSATTEVSDLISSTSTATGEIVGKVVQYAATLLDLVRQHGVSDIPSWAVAALQLAALLLPVLIP